MSMDACAWTVKPGDAVGTAENPPRTPGGDGMEAENLSG